MSISFEFITILGKATILAKTIAEYEPKNAKVLFPCGDLKRNELEDTLKLNEIVVDPVICYKTKPREDLRAIFGTLDMILDYVVFYSPSGVKSAFDILVETIPNFKYHSKLIAIGPTTAESLKTYASSNILVASKPNAESIAQIIRDN